jgi:outer membrane protein OmpA-like peptidoglycan-associated protein
MRFCKFYIFWLLGLLVVECLPCTSVGQLWRRQQQVQPQAARYKLAAGYHRRGLYREALEVYRDLQQQQKGNADTLFSRRIAECEYGIKRQSSPEPVTITRLDTMINSLGYASFSAFAMNDEQTLYFTSSRYSSGKPNSQSGESSSSEGRVFDRVCIARRATLTSPWKVTTLEDKESGQFHEGVLNVSPDGRFLFIFRGNNEILVQDIQQLQQGVNFVPIAQAFNLKISNKYHISSLATADNAQTIYLCINGGKFNDVQGYGGYDIWRTTRDPITGTWSELSNMGSLFNTAGNEISISVLPDGKTLFFASDGLKGVGGYDIFRSTYIDSLKTWSNPVHLGYPINTPNNDVYYNSVFNNPRHAYYSVGRPDVADAYDVCLISYYGEILSDEEYERRRLVFIGALEKVKELPIKPKNAKRLAKKKYVKLSAETPITPGVKMIFREIQFSKNKSKLLLKSYQSLDALYYWLNWHTGVSIRISGYTDNVGTKSVNFKLSRARAQSVANYLIAKGIDPARIDVKGYGRKRPIASNKTSNGRDLNRRVEFSIIARTGKVN